MTLVQGTITDLYQQEKLKFFRGRYNILDCGTRTGKTYWAVNNLKDFTRDGELRRILFLVDTTALKESLITNYSDLCCDADIMWKRPPDTWTSEDINKIGIMCYQGLGMAAMRDDVSFLDSIDVICWDECDTIFDFAAEAFVRARKKDFSRKTSSNAEILHLIQEHSTNKDYMPLVFLGLWEKLVNDSRILCIGLSATPERARMYYDSLTSAVYQGKIQTAYKAAQDIYFKNIHDHLKLLTPVPGIGYWCFSPSISHNMSIVREAKERGFHAIEIHSLRNLDYPMTDEQKRVADCITTLKIVPFEYDFVVITRAYERGVDIVDPRFQHVIIDSYYQSDRIQAARQVFPYQRHVKVLTEAVPEDYMNRWFDAEEARQLAEYMSIPDISVGEDQQSTRRSRPMTWNKLQQFLPKIGYEVKKGRRRLKKGEGPQICYYITGEWHDVEIVAEDNFLSLVAAKSNQEIIDSERIDCDEIIEDGDAE